jgi:diphthine-ammonia ligase
MKCAVLFSGGKDSTYATYLAKKEGYTISCLISIISENPESYMFHTPSISKVEK